LGGPLFCEVLSCSLSSSCVNSTLATTHFVAVHDAKCPQIIFLHSTRTVAVGCYCLIIIMSVMSAARRPSAHLRVTATLGRYYSIPTDYSALSTGHAGYGDRRIWVRGPGWPDHLCQVIAAYALRLNSRAGTEGSTVSFLYCDCWLILSLEALSH